MAYVPTRADATPAATDLAARLTTAGVPVALRDTLVAMLDSILCSVGVQGAPVINTHGPGASNTTASTSFVNMPTGASGTFTAPVAKTYQLVADLSDIFATAGTTIIFFKFVVNGVGVTPTNAMTLTRNVANDRGFISLRQSVALVAGSNTIQLQWSVNVGAAGSATWDAASGLVLTVQG